MSKEARASPATVRMYSTYYYNTRLYVRAGRFLFIVFHIPFSTHYYYYYSFSQHVGRSASTDFRQFLTKRAPVSCTSILRTI